MRMRLVERARDGDEVAFSELVDLDGDMCFGIAYRILRDAERAQDAVQQAYLLAWRELPRLRDAERFGMTVVSVQQETAAATALYGGPKRLLEAFIGTMNVWPEDRMPSPPESVWPPQR